MKNRFVYLAVVTILATIIAGCGGGGSSQPTVLPLPPLPSSAFAVASDTTFVSIGQPGNILTDQQIQDGIAANPSNATVGVTETDKVVSLYEISAAQAASPGSPTGTTAATVTLYGLADGLAKVRVAISNCVIRTDGSYFMNGVVSIIRPTILQQVPDTTFQFSTTGASDFQNQFSYSPQAFAVSSMSYNSLLKFAYLTVTREQK